ncbi:hypothetical protein B0H11DRAFT_1951660 [Mycena galericulata]|nr:hypothetical protein B0H11DRAFT_1951660 [Mycena galericulata]
MLTLHLFNIDPISNPLLKGHWTPLNGHPDIISCITLPGPNNLCTATLKFNETRFQVIGLPSVPTFLGISQNKIENTVSFNYFSGLPPFNSTGPPKSIPPKANLTFSFAAKEAAPYGAIGVNGDDFTVQFDGGSPMNISQQNTSSHAISHSSGNPGNHSVTLFSPTSASGFTLNYTILASDSNSVQSTPSLPSLSNTSQPSATRHPQGATHHGGLSAMSIFIPLMVVIAVLVALLVAALAYVLYLRHKRRRKTSAGALDNFHLPPSTEFADVERNVPAAREPTESRFFEPARWTADARTSRSSTETDSTGTLDGYPATSKGRSDSEVRGPAESRFFEPSRWMKEARTSRSSAGTGSTLDDYQATSKEPWIPNPTSESMERHVNDSDEVPTVHAI